MKHYMMRLADEIMIKCNVSYEHALEEAMKIMSRKGQYNGKQ